MPSIRTDVGSGWDRVGRSIMRDALPALGFLAALVIVPFIVSLSIAWAILHYTDTGLLIGRGQVTTIASDQASDGEKKVVECPYFTSDGFVQRVVDYKEYGYHGKRDCPWRINVSA